ncbi:MAG: hypothetical protein J3K34DRAFT_525487 [Monoraphidium minutum]|nr:MAG: hypothetical protein J3K34DRAFT_525487 [Monoraphidium minutum]
MAHITAAIETMCQRWGERPVWHCSGVGTPARALHAAVACASRALSALLGCTPGDRVALLGLNTPEYQAALLAAADAGCVACPLNTRWSPAELAAALALVAPRAVLVDAACLALLRAAASQPGCCGFEAVLLTPLDGGARPPGDGAAPPPARSLAGLLQREGGGGGSADGPGARPRLRLLQPPDGSALICFTSGTTSAPKGAVLTHAALMHQSMAKLAVVRYTPRDTYLHMAPLCHIGGLSSALAATLAGAAQVFMPRYSASEAVRLVGVHRVTALIAVPTMMEDAVEVLGGGGADGQGGEPDTACLPSVLRVLVGGGGMRPRLAPLVARLFPNAAVSSAYGMTEAASSITFLAPALPPPAEAAGRCEDAASTSGSGSSEGGTHGGLAAPSGVCVGWPAPGVQVAIFGAGATDTPSSSGGDGGGASTSGSSDRGGSERAGGGSGGGGTWEAAPGVVGEVLTRGPHVMAGYWRDPQQTRAALLPGGWLRTGDLGWLDARGRLWLLGRAKDTVKSGGENVHAAEVEAALEGHPGVAAAAVVGLPDTRLGETVAAAVVLRPGWSWRGEGAAGGPRGLGARQLQDYCRAAGLTPYKLPRRLAPLPELPRNSSGKVVKPAVRELLLGAAARSAL